MNCYLLFFTLRCAMAHLVDPAMVWARGPLCSLGRVYTLKGRGRLF